jgi:hypothetical protein
MIVTVHKSGDGEDSKTDAEPSSARRLDWVADDYGESIAIFLFLGVSCIETGTICLEKRW